MGAYYGLINYTKGHKVSHYWKNSPPGIFELYLIAEVFGWELKTDMIASVSNRNRYSYDNQYNRWENDIYDSCTKYWKHKNIKCVKKCNPNMMFEHWEYFDESKNQPNPSEFVNLGLNEDDVHDEEYAKTHGVEYVEEKFYEYINQNRIFAFDVPKFSEDMEKIKNYMESKKVKDALSETEVDDKMEIQEYSGFFKGYTSDISKNIEISKKYFNNSFFCN